MSSPSIVPNILAVSVLDFPGGAEKYNKTVALTVIAVAEQLMVTHAYQPSEAIKDAEDFMRLSEKYVREFKGVFSEK